MIVFLMNVGKCNYKRGQLWLVDYVQVRTRKDVKETKTVEFKASLAYIVSSETALDTWDLSQPSDLPKQKGVKELVTFHPLNLVKAKHTYSSWKKITNSL